MEPETTATDPPAEPREPSVDHLERRHSNLEMDGIRIATLAVLAVDTLIVVLLALYLVTTVTEQRKANECYQNQADQLLISITAARDAARQERAGQLAMLNTILDPGSSVDTRRRAVEGWRQALSDADRTRADAPTPIPRCTQLRDQ